MKKILIGCFLMISAIPHPSTSAVMKTLEQLDFNFQSIEIEKRIIYNKFKYQCFRKKVYLK